MRELDVVGVRVEMPANNPMVLLREVGGVRYLPIWIGAMETALQGVPQGTQSAPEDVVAVDVASTRRGGTAKEYFFKSNVPSNIEPEPADSGSKPVD